MQAPIIAASGLGSIALANLAAAPPAAAQDARWHGFHLGAIAGYEAGRALPGVRPGGSGAENLRFVDGVPRFSTDLIFAPQSNSASFGPLAGEGGGRPHGVLAGLIAGYGWQRGDWVFGIETDASLAGETNTAMSVSGSQAFDGGSPTGAGTRSTSFSQSASLDWLVTVRPRVGFTIKRALLFASAGIALGRATVATSAALDEAYVDPIKTYTARARWSGRRASTRLGYILGGGVEYALTSNAAIRVEGYYYDLGTIRTEAAGSGSYTSFGGETPMSVAPYVVRRRMDGAMLRVGVTWRF